MVYFVKSYIGGTFAMFAGKIWINVLYTNYVKHTLNISYNKSKCLRYILYIIILMTFLQTSALISRMSLTLYNQSHYEPIFSDDISFNNTAMHTFVYMLLDFQINILLVVSYSKQLRDIIYNSNINLKYKLRKKGWSISKLPNILSQFGKIESADKSKIIQKITNKNKYGTPTNNDTSQTSTMDASKTELFESIQDTLVTKTPKKKNSVSLLCDNNTPKKRDLNMSLLSSNAVDISHDNAVQTPIKISKRIVKGNDLFYVLKVIDSIAKLRVLLGIMVIYSTIFYGALFIFEIYYFSNYNSYNVILFGVLFPINSLICFISLFGHFQRTTKHCKMVCLYCI